MKRYGQRDFQKLFESFRDESDDDDSIVPPSIICRTKGASTPASSTVVRPPKEEAVCIINVRNGVGVGQYNRCYIVLLSLRLCHSYKLFVILVIFTTFLR